MESTIDRKDLVTVRNVKMEDKNFIMATWLRGMFYGDTWFGQIPKDIFMTNYHKILEALVTAPTTTITVSCLLEDPDVILGYSVYTGKKLHWVFVKSAWRSIGIAKSLIPQGVDTVTHLTKVGSGILRKHPEVVFNPFAI